MTHQVLHLVRAYCGECLELTNGAQLFLLEDKKLSRVVKIETRPFCAEDKSLLLTVIENERQTLRFPYWEEKCEESPKLYVYSLRVCYEVGFIAATVDLANAWIATTKGFGVICEDQNGLIYIAAMQPKRNLQVA